MGKSRTPLIPNQQLDTDGPAAGPSSWLDNSFLNNLLGAGGTGGAYGTAGAMGREGSVQAMHQAAYNLGADAPQVDHSGSVFRNVQDRHAPSMFEAQWGAKSGGRYNASNQQLIYTSPSAAESIGEAHAYDGMAGRTMVEANYNATVDPATGTGGVAQVTDLAAQRGMTSALTPRVGKGGPGPLWNLLGEHPYTQTQQVGQGATDAGAAAIHAPSATGGNQLDIIPRNNPANAITPLEVTPFDSTGTAGPSTPAGTTIKGMGVDTSPHTPGVVEFEPGSIIRPPTANEPVAPGRATSTRYGALGGGVAAAGSDLYRMYNGENVGAGQLVADTAVGTGMGAGSALATDALIAGGRSATSAGGIVGGVIEGGMSAYNNINAYRDGKESGNQAAANVIVDTGVGVGAGMAGAAMGAAIGSIIPGAGTLVGAGLGFLGGMAGSYLVHALADKTGAAAWAKEELGAGLGYAYDGITSAGSAIGSGLSTAGGYAMDGLSAAGSAIGSGVSAVGSGLSTAGGYAMDGLSAAGSAIGSGVSAVGSGLASAGGAAMDGISSVGSSIAGGASKAWDAVTSW